MKKERNKASFRDPDGFIFHRDALVYRQLNESCREDYEMLMNSGLYRALVDAELLIPHEEVDIEAPEPEKAFKVIQPELIPFISYPYEWCFSQLKDAALTTLKIQKIAFGFGMLANQMFPAALGVFIIVLVQDLGFAAILWGTIQFLPRIFDAITDPIMANVAAYIASGDCADAATCDLSLGIMYGYSWTLSCKSRAS